MFKMRIPPPLYALAAALIMLGMHWYLPGTLIVGDETHRWAWLVALPGGVLVIWAAALFRRAHTTLDPVTPSRASRLVTDGPFRFSRNPIYLGLVFALFGWAVWLGSLSDFVVPPLFIALITRRQIMPEEKALEALFGDEYIRYRKQVHRWFGRGRCHRGATLHPRSPAG
ncbi:MAG: methyltransferase family protein [Acidiferrobacterales bacterium]